MFWQLVCHRAHAAPVRDREQRPVSRNGTNGNGGGLSRLTAQQTRQRLDQDAAPRYALFDEKGQPVKNGVSVPVKTLAPLAPAPISLPVTLTEMELEIRAEGAATGFAIQSEYELVRRRSTCASPASGRRSSSARRAGSRHGSCWRRSGRRGTSSSNGLPRRLRRLVRRKLNRLLQVGAMGVCSAPT